MGKKIEFEPRRGHIGKKVEGSPEKRPLAHALRRMKTGVRIKDVPKNLQGKAAFLLAELLLLKKGIDPDKNRPLLEETIMKAEQETVVSLSAHACS